MVQARLIRAAFLIGLLAIAAAFERLGLDSGERPASDSLQTLSAPEADFRACDRDWNQVNDFWTTDVRGLYAAPPAPEQPE